MRFVTCRWVVVVPSATHVSFHKYFLVMPSSMKRTTPGKVVVAERHRDTKLSSSANLYANISLCFVTRVPVSSSCIRTSITTTIPTSIHALLSCQCLQFHPQVEFMPTSLLASLIAPRASLPVSPSSWIQSAARDGSGWDGKASSRTVFHRGRLRRGTHLPNPGAI